ARLSGVDISIIQLVFMKYRKIPPDLIVRAMIKCTKAGVEIDHEALEAHYLAGGNLENVINGLIYAKAKNKKLTFMQASKLDLGRIDIVKELDKT
ncbi:MAG: flotillin-like FloA family protein, partial [Bacteroidales bacterium]|nr:flotillin-like FloA family protein [Bacteroidales bacterium]